jgi:hypothetical protein
METVLKLKVSTGKREFGIGFDEKSGLLAVSCTQVPEKGKANKEILKELKKFFKADVEIVSGIKSKEKVVRIFTDPLRARSLLDAKQNTSYF